jgi:hypothetical protein
MVSKMQLAAVILSLGAAPLTANAQQSFPRPIVLYRPPVAAAALQPSRGPSTITPRGPSIITSASFPTNAVTPGGPQLNPPAGNAAVQQAVQQAGQTAGQTGSTSQAGSSSEYSQSADPAANQQKTPEQELAQQQSRPTNQMLQNPSGAANLTHSGFTSSQQMAPNLYFGQQFQAWTNQQPVAQMPATYGEMGRFQPGPSGGYTAPNTYLGSGFSSWSNLSQGGATPGATGSWNYSVWP